LIVQVSSKPNAVVSQMHLFSTSQDEIFLFLVETNKLLNERWPLM